MERGEARPARERSLPVSFLEKTSVRLWTSRASILVKPLSLTWTSVAVGVAASPVPRPSHGLGSRG